MNETQSTLSLIAEARTKAIADFNAKLTKGFSTSTGLINYDLQRPAVRAVPVYTPLRDMIPRTKGNGDVATHWKIITSFDNANTSVGVAEGLRGGVKQVVVTPKIATYSTIGIEDNVSFEADEAADGFDDVLALAVESNLYQLEIQEETMILGGNASFDLGTTPTPTVSVSATGGTIGAAQKVYCVALTLQGLKQSSVTGGIALTYTRTNAGVSSTSTVSGFHAAKSAVASPTWSTGSTDSITCSVTPVTGAFGYAWYWGTAGNEVLGAITTINSYIITAAANGTQNISAVTDNASRDALSFDGIINSMITSGSGSYLKTMPSGTLGIGTGLTSDGAAGVVEINDACVSMLSNYKTRPDALIVSPKMKNYLRKLVVGNGGAALVRYNMDAQGNHQIDGGNELASIQSPVGGSMKIIVSFDIPDNTIILMSKNLPAEYFKYNNLGTTLALKHRKRDYYAIEWPLVNRRYEYGTYVSELLQNYFPPAFGMITNIAIS